LRTAFARIAGIPMERAQTLPAYAYGKRGAQNRSKSAVFRRK
jgi:hypothetical protein